MSAKKQTDKKVFDVTSPKKVTPSSTSRPVIVTNRPMITRDPMVSGIADDQGQPSAPPLPSGSEKKSITIRPLHDDIDKKATTPEEVPATANETPEAESGEHDKVETETPEPAIVEEPKSDEESKEEKADTKEDVPEPPKESADKADDQLATPKAPPKDDAEAAKAEALARQRTEEMQKLIDSHQFFVPVNAVQRKRSTWASFWMTLLVIALSVALIDLMLDANVIELIQKLPHTHFFEAKPH